MIHSLLKKGQPVRDWESLWNGVREEMQEARNTIDSFKQELKEEESKK